MTISLVLAQEADTVWTASGRVQGATVVPPQAESLERLKRLASDFRRFKADRIYCSENDPGESSGQVVADFLGLPLIKTELLRPLDLGIWEGLLEMEVRAQFGRAYRRWRAKPEMFAPPDGELLLEAEKRLEALLEEIRIDDESVIIIGSVPMLSILCGRTLPRYGADISEGREPESNVSLWQMFDLEQRWMAWDLLLDDEG